MRVYFTYDAEVYINRNLQDPDRHWVAIRAIAEARTLRCEQRAKGWEMIIDEQPKAKKPYYGWRRKNIG